MRIWVDADACPAVIKDILYRAAERSKIPLTLVANKPPPSPYIRALQVPRAQGMKAEVVVASAVQSATTSS